MNRNARLQIVRNALRDGTPLHRIEAYLDWLDAQEAEGAARTACPSPSPVQPGYRALVRDGLVRFVKQAFVSLAPRRCCAEHRSR